MQAIFVAQVVVIQATFIRLTIPSVIEYNNVIAQVVILVVELAFPSCLETYDQTWQRLVQATSAMNYIGRTVRLMTDTLK
jgi:hypothetical protein